VESIRGTELLDNSDSMSDFKTQVFSFTGTEMSVPHQVRPNSTSKFEMVVEKDYAVEVPVVQELD
jgi:hypothetical protein